MIKVNFVSEFSFQYPILYTQCDFLVVGQGLAGSLLSFCLQQEGKTVLVLDKLTGNASRVAAGMFNLLTGRRLTHSWLADDFLAAADSIYKELEKCLGQQFYFPMPVLRIFGSEDDYRVNLEKHQQQQNPFIKHFLQDVYMDGMKPVEKACEISGGGYINTEIFLNSWRDKLLSDNNLLEEDFDFESLQILEDGILYKDIKAGKIIFCEGYQAVFNPYFKWLPFNLAKGDVLTIYAPGLQEKAIINKGIYIVPLGNASFRVGATYIWQTLDPNPSETAREELETELRKIIDVDYTVTDHKAGIRPTVKQRRPFLGFHPQHKNIGIFNGLGTKGVLLGPLLAQQFTNHILYHQNLLPETDIAFYKKEFVKG
ncbi:MAG: FAD-binding oxidoreductase [Sphingobacteriales bacterium]|nr:MAG: FAD-binding oxidoreductase [Sphingobacteriales bacterium]